MTKALTFLIAGASALCMSPALAETQPCGQRDGILDALSQKYGEVRTSVGLTSNGWMMETFAADGGSWTITVTKPDGTTCLIAAGKSYEQVAAGAAIAGEPS
ncbi:hypothetical protein [Palleronia caenipelagi]|uniref:PepSY domain-containing protein n=1 Tax=Palleronia caenipelagi TaxID=2489174 RepID=A0A547QAS6_9RHOB|nr:hypothetical protein [Palleronia caenipelagi]TRD23493.1 hypothetical protein FEV53_00305 [Palleronia caenipelagi]